MQVMMPWNIASELLNLCILLGCLFAVKFGIRKAQLGKETRIDVDGTRTCYDCRQWIVSMFACVALHLLGQVPSICNRKELHTNIECSSLAVMCANYYNTSRCSFESYWECSNLVGCFHSGTYSGVAKASQCNCQRSCTWNCLSTSPYTNCTRDLNYERES